MENTLEQKQTFLRENILEKGYDAEQFMSFLQSKKGEQGLDLNNWLIEELYNAVNEFISFNPQLNNFQSPNQQENNIPIDNNNFDLVNMNNNQNNNDQNEEIIKNEKSTEVYLPCQKVEISELNQVKNVNIRLSFPEKVEGGIFTKSYVTYLIQTEPFGYKVRKRYSDFEWLQNALSTNYIYCVIPPLCKKNYSGRFNEILIAKRTRSLEKFMKAVLAHPILSNDPIFHDFISIENENDFQAKKKNYKIQSPNFISESKSLNGEVKVTLNNEKEIYFANIKDNADINEEILQKITKNYKALILLMQQVSDKMKEISDIWKILYNKSTKYYESTNTYESYNIMSKLMSEWSELQKREIILLNNDLREYFRFIKNEFHSLKDLALKVDTHKMTYSKAEERLTAIKESLFKSQDINSWELNPIDMNNRLALLSDKNLAFSKMLPKETKKMNQVKNLYGFYVNSVINEYERFRNSNGKTHKESITNFIKSLNEALNEFNVNLCDYMTYFVELKDEEGFEKKGDEKGNNGQQENLDG